jgi:HK97 family phage major capsid protein
MRSSSEIAKEILALQARVEAIVAMAKDESRDLTQDETTEVDAILGTDKESGKIAALRVEKDRSQRIENAAIDIVRKHDEEESAPKRMKIPARAKAGMTLKAFKSEEDAYVSGQFIRAAIFNHKSARQWCRDHGVKATMTTGDNTLGGFLVPEPLEAAIIELREQYGVIRQNATVMPMSQAVVNMPRLNTEITTYYVGEGASITASDPVFNQIKLEAKKLATLTQISSEMGEDSVIGVADILARSIAQQFAIAEDQAGFIGDGTSTYGGIVGLAGALAAGSKVTATSRQTFSALTLADFESVIGQAKLWAGAMPKWYISQAGMGASMMRLADAGSGNTVETLASGFKQRTFLGYPVVISQVLESRLTGTTGVPACYFGDLSAGVYMGSRRGISVVSDSSRYFDQDLVAIRATQRFDIVVHDRGTASASGGLIQLVFG